MESSSVVVNMAKTKELSEDLRMSIVNAYKDGKGYKALSKLFSKPVSTVQSIIKKYKKKFNTVKNIGKRGRKPKVSPRLARKVCPFQPQNNNQDTSGQLGFGRHQGFSADNPPHTAQRRATWAPSQKDTSTHTQASKSSPCICQRAQGQGSKLLVISSMVRRDKN